MQAARIKQRVSAAVMSHTLACEDHANGLDKTYVTEDLWQQITVAAGKLSQARQDAHAKKFLLVDDTRQMKKEAGTAEQWESLCQKIVQQLDPAVSEMEVQLRRHAANKTASELD